MENFGGWYKHINTFTDFSLKVDDKLFSCHRFILGTRSEWFSNYFKKHGDAKVVDLDDQIQEWIEKDPLLQPFRKHIPDMSWSFLVSAIYRGTLWDDEADGGVHLGQIDAIDEGMHFLDPETLKQIHLKPGDVKAFLNLLILFIVLKNLQLFESDINKYQQFYFSTWHAMMIYAENEMSLELFAHALRYFGQVQDDNMICLHKDQWALSVRIWARWIQLHRPKSKYLERLNYNHIHAEESSCLIYFTRLESAIYKTLAEDEKEDVFYQPEEVDPEEDDDGNVRGDAFQQCVLSSAAQYRLYTLPRMERMMLTRGERDEAWYIHRATKQIILKNTYSLFPLLMDHLELSGKAIVLRPIAEKEFQSFDARVEKLIEDIKKRSNYVSDLGILCTNNASRCSGQSDCQFCQISNRVEFIKNKSQDYWDRREDPVFARHHNNKKQAV